ncbi:MAG: TonB-dependent receptor plug domain-containing protein [Balneolales bacterium]
MKHFRALCILIAVLSVITTQAHTQSLTDTLRLDDILIEATRVPEPRKNQPVQVQLIDSLQISLSGPASLANILENHTGLFIRNYGPSGASTISQRGMLAHQTQIYWKGFNLNHPMLGLFDLNTFPAGMLSGIEINSAGSSVHGSGNMGGSIQLSTDEGFSGAAVSQSAGSYGRYSSSARAGAASDKWELNVQAMLDQSENDFHYGDRTRFPVEDRRRSNNQVETQSLLVNGLKTFSNSEFSSGLWYGHTDRGVPGPMQSLTQQATQEDEFARWYGNYQVQMGGVQTGIKSFLNRQELNFIDPQNGINSISTNMTGLLEVPGRYVISDDIQINGLITTSQSSINSTAYNDVDQSRSHFSAQLNPLIRPINRLRLYPSARIDQYSDFGTAISYALGANYALIPENLHWRFYAGTDFNAPTFNDLFWPESGNPDLKPEEGWKAETGFYSSMHYSGIVQQTDAQVFINRLKNGIQWLALGSNYRPQNIREIQSQGFEIQSNTTLLHDLFRLKVSQLVSGTWATYGKPRFPGDQATGNQLVHTPRWQYRLTFSLFSGPVNSMVAYRRVGERFTDENNISTIDAYSAVDFSISYNLEILGIRSGIRWNINNLLDSSYEVIPFYPIPGRNHLVTLKFNI